ncbi:MAG: tetratricopeptide repeat protein [Chitinophagaceae bacterium]|jgi:tetratricopeptide (TPR) repeat protein
MKLYNFYIRYRLQIGIISLILAVASNLFFGFWPSLALYIIAVLSIFTHFFIGPLRIIQEYLEEGDFDGAEKVLNGIKYPGLLYKPIRSVYYTLKGNIAMTKQDFDSAEKHMKKSLDLGLPMKEAEGANKLQLGMMAMQKGNMKEGESLIRQAIRLGIPDKESSAMAYLQMCQIMMQKREFRAAKDFFKKAKAQKPTTTQVVDQIKQIEKYISRMPG